MANHKSALKRIRQTRVRRLRNRYYGTTTRNLIRKLKNITEKQEAQELLPTVISAIDKLAKRNVIHNNKAANLKSQVTKFVNGL